MQKYLKNVKWCSLLMRRDIYKRFWPTILSWSLLSWFSGRVISYSWSIWPHMEPSSSHTLGPTKLVFSTLDSGHRQCLPLSTCKAHGHLFYYWPFCLVFFKWTIPGLFFLIFVFSMVQLVDKISPMSGFELKISGILAAALPTEPQPLPCI